MLRILIAALLLTTPATAAPLDDYLAKVLQEAGDVRRAADRLEYAAERAIQERASKPVEAPVELPPEPPREPEPEPTYSSAWREMQVTRDYWDVELQRRWGDRRFVGEPIATASAGKEVRITLPAGTSDVLLEKVDGPWLTLGTRESQTPPYVQFEGDRFPVLADVSINPTTVQNLGGSDSARLNDTSYAYLLRVEPQSGPAQLVLPVRGSGTGTPVVNAYAPLFPIPQPVIPDLPVATQAVMKITPAEVQNPKSDRQILRADHLETWTDYASAPQVYCTQDPRGCSGLTLWSHRVATPRPMKRAAMVTYFRMSGEWTSTGGKLPGLGNSGDVALSSGQKHVVNGVAYSPAGWGGRKPDGLHWSERGLFFGSGKGMGAYSYALNTMDGSYGGHLNGAVEIPHDRIVAAIQYIDVNTPGRDDGKLALIICTSDGCQPSLYRGDIRYRTVDHELALINEVLAEVYGGGMLIAMNPGDRMQYDFYGATVYDAMPADSTVVATIKALED